jgi:predicted RND superfamily exporter protein
VLLTTLTTSLGLLPMAIGFPRYSLIWGSMASTFVTGLVSATALTLFVVPVLWDMVQDLQEGKLGLKQKLHQGWLFLDKKGRLGQRLASMSRVVVSWFQALVNLILRKL